MLRWLLLAAGLVGLFATAMSLDRNERGLLWRVVEACILDHAITGSALPCLAVETGDGGDRGYAVLRSPLDTTHVIVTPTVRTIGIEAPRLRGPGAPNYFHDAWLARRFVRASDGRAPARDELALAVNSRMGRSQDQLHIHVDCVRPDVRATLAQQQEIIRNADWSRRKVLPWGPLWWAHFVPSEDLAGLNLFDQVADALKVTPDGLAEVTIVAVGSEAKAGTGGSERIPAGFFVLARKRVPHSFDEAHGEAMLDRDCGADR